MGRGPERGVAEDLLRAAHIALQQADAVCFARERLGFAPDSQQERVLRVQSFPEGLLLSFPLDEA